MPMVLTQKTNMGIQASRSVIAVYCFSGYFGSTFDFLFYLVGYYVTLSLRTRFRTLPDPLLGRESTNLTTRGAL